MTTIADLIGLPLYARRMVMVRQSPRDGAQIVRTVSPGQLVGTIFSYHEQRSENISWFISFKDPSLPGGYGYVSYDQQALDMPRVKLALDARIEAERRQRLGPNGRALEDAGGAVRDVAETAGSNLLSGAMLLGGVYILGKLITR
jgi:hypothetical protein